MIKDIVKDRDFLSKPAEPATAEDAEVAEDLRDTIESLEDCVCLAANQIGSNKAIIAYEDNGRIAVMFNPKIKMAAQPYQTQESCPFARRGERGEALPDDFRGLPGHLERQPCEPHEAPVRLDSRARAARHRSLRWQARLR